MLNRKCQKNKEGNMAEKKKKVVPEVKKETAKQPAKVREGRYYKLLPQVDSKKKELFLIEDDAVGRASKEFVLLARAKKEISNHLNDSMAELIAELRKAERKTISFCVGASVVSLVIKHVDAKEVIVIEK
jgi:hypothetical protein